MNFLLNFHAYALETASPALHWLLNRRLRQGKEDGPRLGERRGEPGIQRPPGALIWVHGASIGEAQSTLVMIDHLKRHFPQARILLTTGTVSSARYLETRLPPGVIHQYYPLDRPRWVSSFLDHWQPDFVLWMESELWPAMLNGIRQRKIPAVLVNGRLSPRSLKRWQYLSGTARILLQTFVKILTQTDHDASSFRTLGAQNVTVSGNLKYAAIPLSADDQGLNDLRASLHTRPAWLYASTHKGEEEMACRVHQALSPHIPGLLTIVVPRHPERRDDIIKSCHDEGLTIQLRTADKIPPTPGTAVYIADTLGELGLFYRVVRVACIGRSFSDDGGGGHNPIEAAQLGCAVLHGPHIQNLSMIYGDMNQAGAVRMVTDENDLIQVLKELLTDDKKRQTLAEAGQEFVSTQNTVLENILADILPLLSAALTAKAGKR